MKNLENFGVQEMNAKEMRNTDGGTWALISFIVVIVLLAINGLTEDRFPTE